ncbi:MAG: PfkB family carbohydrate kinase [Pseudomonadota bacterium]
MTSDPSRTILCIGSVLWDVIGRSPLHMRRGADVPGRITRLPGGVALNIAMTLVRFGMTPVLLSAVGRDSEGEDLVRACEGLGLDTGHLYRSDDLPTDRYMAVEGANGLIAAIADAHSLEAAGGKILRPLLDGAFGQKDRPYDGLVALDGNLTQALLDEISQHPAFSRADLRVAPASPGKASRLLPFLTAGRATLYVNLEEAGLLAGCQFDTSQAAAQHLVERGAARVVVTHGDQAASDADRNAVITQTPPEVLVTRVTGAGDTFMAAHIAAGARGLDRAASMSQALDAAATYVSGGQDT